MRPLKLEIKVFGTFAKPQVIDFEQALQGEQIFVVSGPTGAGKTTIFDAISFALYGKSSTGNREGSELRSDFCSNSTELTTVIFEFEVGEKRYRIERSPKQAVAKKNGTGTTKKAASQMFKELDSEARVLTDNNEIKQKIKELLHLDHNQFCKIVMIPQGDFKKFLVAKTSEKMPLLQRIFGTEIYEKVQQELRNKADEIKQKAEEIQKEIAMRLESFTSSNVELLHQVLNEGMSYEEKFSLLQQELTQVNEDLQLKKETLEKETTATLQLEHVLKEIDEVNQKFTELECLLKERELLEQQKEAIEQKRYLVNQADAAKEVIRAQSLRDNKQQALTVAVQQLTRTTSQLEEIKQRQADYELRAAIQPELEHRLNQDKHELPLLQRDEQTMLSIGKTQQDIAQAKNVYRQLSQELSNMTTLYQEKQAKRQPVEVLLNQLKKLEVDQSNISRAQSEITSTYFTFNRAKEVSNSITTLHQKLHQEVQLVEQLSAQYVQYVQRKEQVSLAMYQGMAQTLAKTLTQNEPCPVCGSRLHPQIAVSQGEGLAEQDIERAEQAVNQVQQQLITAQTNCNHANQSLEQAKAEITNLFQQLNIVPHQTLSYERQLHQYQEMRLKRENELEVAMKQVINGRNIIQMKLTNEERLGQEIESLREQIKQKEQAYHQIDVTLQRAQSKLAEMQQSLSGRYQSYEEVSRDRKEKEQVIRRYEQQLAQLVEEKNQLTQHHVQLQATLVSEQQHVNQLTIEHQQLNEQAHQQLVQTFETVEAFEAYCPYLAYITAYQLEIKQFDEAVFAKTERQKQLQESLKGKQCIDREPHANALAKKKQEREALLQDCSSQEVIYNQNVKLVTKVMSQYEKNKRLADDYRMMGDLADLATGKGANKVSLESYVLSSYFDEVLQFANHRLAKMTNGRYQLLRQIEVSGNGVKGLELDVHDTYTAKTRAVGTLSGGETFKASLALALGMSDAVIHHAGGVSLDTMFIDEGFGTLDSESLEQAIEILSELQSHGRLIGVISHVEELKKRIHVKLMVEPSQVGSVAYFQS